MEKEFEKELKQLLCEGIADAELRESRAFDKIAGNNKKIILFGSGDLGRRTAKGLKELGVDALCFADNNKKLWGTTISDLAVLAPEEAVIKHPEAVFVLTIWSANIGHPLKEVHSQLNLLKETTVISFVYLYWKYPQTFLPYWRCNLPHKTLEQFELVSSAFNLWSDDSSRREYLAQINWRITGNSENLLPPVKDDQYFPEDIFKVADDEVFVDIGAFDGDTLKVFLTKNAGNFEQYYAFEPDPFGYVKLNEYVSTFSKELAGKIIAEPIGLGSCSEKINVETPGDYFKILYPEEAAIHISKNKSGYAEVDSKALDELDLKFAPTFIKMDVEGFEPNIIFGAQEVIKKHKPIIAIAIYHKHDHIWRLPLAIHALSKDYNFYLRPHFRAGWELICYAVPKHRVKTV